MFPSLYFALWYRSNFENSDVDTHCWIAHLQKWPVALADSDYSNDYYVYLAYSGLSVRVELEEE